MASIPRKESFSWMDSLFRRIEKLPIRPWLTYLLMYVGFVILFQLIAWLDSLRTLGQFSITTFFNSVWVPAGLAGLHYLNSEARKVLDDLRPMLDCSDEAFRKMYWQMSTIPQPIVLSIQALVGIVLIAVARSDPGRLSPELRSSTGTLWFAVAFMTLGFSNVFIYFYQTLRRLGLVNRIYAMVKDINIFTQQPLYSLSGFNIKVGFIWILFINLNIVSFLLQTGPQATTYPLIFVEILLVIFVFLLPVLGIHSRILGAKETLLSENGNQLRAINIELNKSLDKRKHEEIVAFEKGIAALVSMRSEIGNSPTWPWDPGTFRNFLSAVFLPILLFIIQQFLVGYL
jgi:hypothetical protein